MNVRDFWIYLLVMAGVTYLVRAVPFVLIRRKIKNRFLISFLYYIPYTVLAAMTFPAIFFCTDSILSAAAGALTALVLAYFDKGLLLVAAASAVVIYLVGFLV